MCSNTQRYLPPLTFPAFSVQYSDSNQLKFLDLPFYYFLLFLSFCYTYLGETSVQSLSHVLRFVIPWTASRQASLSITNSRSLLKVKSIELVMPSNHLVLCHPLLLLPSIFPGIKVLSNESVLRIRWLKCWHFSFSISPSNEYSGLISFRIDWFG